MCCGRDGAGALRRRTSWATASTSRRRPPSKGLEGIVAKRRLSPYQPGRRSRDWLKIKLRREQEIVVVGWLPGQGTHKDLGSLIVAVNDDGGLRHAGQVGSGINARMRKELLAAMEPIRRRGRAAGQEAAAAARRAGSSRGS